MKITRGRLTEIIAEEIEARVSSLREAGKPKKNGPSKPGIASADDEPSPEQDGEPAGGTVKTPDADPVPAGTSSNKGPDVQALDGEENGPGDAPDSSEDEPEEPDTEEPNPDEPTGAVNDEISGKTVQALTIEPKSKVLPGAKEVVLAFNESTDALRILVTATGQVKFFWRGQLHDLP
jgi:hypothetical protein